MTGIAICSARPSRARTAGSPSAAADKALVSTIIPGYTLQVIHCRPGYTLQVIGFRSAPDFAIDLFKGALHAFFNLLFFFAQVLELAKVFQPGPFARRNLKLLLHRFGHELAQGDAALGGDRLRPAKQGIRYFERSLHCPILPYLWDAGLTSV